jgi:hypothetical protein
MHDFVINEIIMADDSGNGGWQNRSRRVSQELQVSLLVAGSNASGLVHACDWAVPPRSSHHPENHRRSFLVSVGSDNEGRLSGSAGDPILTADL